MTATPTLFPFFDRFTLGEALILAVFFLSLWFMLLEGANERFDRALYAIFEFDFVWKYGLATGMGINSEFW